MDTANRNVALKVQNHFVPRLYLKRFAADGKCVWTYRLIVAHTNVPEWTHASTKSLARHEHLYTRIIASGETDEIERWLDSEFEAPAEEAIEKAVSGQRLTADDWKRLVKFLAAQDVRTPARLLENSIRWNETYPKLLQDTLKKSVEKLEAAQRSGAPLPQPRFPTREYLPLRVSLQAGQGDNPGSIKVESLTGRGMWLFSMKHLLTGRIDVLR